MDLILYVTADDITCYKRKESIFKEQFGDMEQFINTQRRLKSSFVDNCMALDSDWLLLDGNKPVEESATKAFKSIIYYLASGHKPRNVQNHRD